MGSDTCQPGLRIQAQAPGSRLRIRAPDPGSGSVSPLTWPPVQLTSSLQLHNRHTLIPRLRLAKKDSAAGFGAPWRPYQMEFLILNCNALASGPWSPGTSAGREPNPEAGF